MRNGAGTYTLPPGNPVVSGTLIESEWANTTMSDLAAALTDSISADGQTNPVANLPMAGFRHLNVSDPALRNQYLALGMAQDGLHTRVTLSDANPNTLNGTMVGWSTGDPAAYSEGLWVSWFQDTENTGAVTLNIGNLGAVSVFNNAGQPLIAGDLPAGTFCLGYYNGSEFQLITDTVSTAGSSSSQASITGYLRPDPYVAVIVSDSNTEIQVAAGNGYIVEAGQGGDVIPVSWSGQVVEIDYLASAYYVTIMVDSTGTIVQFAGSPSAAALRENIMLGTVIVQNNIIASVVPSPAIYGDDGYLFRDTTSFFNNKLVSGGRVTPNASPTHLDISAGVLFRAGGDPSEVTAPNNATFDAAADITFRALAGTDTLGAEITAAPMASYDPAGAGTVTALTGTEAAVHRLYLLGNNFIWVYGQDKYTNFADALLRLNVDRSTYLESPLLGGGTLICEIIAQYNSTSIDDGGVTSAIISSSTQNYLFGSAQSINEAPGGGLLYGRRGSDNSWQVVADATAPIYPGNVTIEKSEPRLIEIFDPIGAGWAGLNVQQDAGFAWFNIEATYPDDKVYFRSYNPATGALRFSTTFDLGTGFWHFPAGTTVGGLIPGDGDVVGPASSVDGEIALFDGTTGKLLKSGVVAGDVVEYDVQTSATDTTAGHVLQVGAFGLGTTGALSMPIGTTAQRPVVTTDAQTRINTDTNVLEYYLGSQWNNVPRLPTGYINGLKVTKHPLGVSVTISAGQCISYDGTTQCISGGMYKKLDAVWAEGGVYGFPGGGRPAAVPLTSGQFYRVFLIAKPDGTTDAGFDTSTTAANLLAAAASAGYTKYRRVGWVQWDGSGIVDYRVKNDKYWLATPVALATSSALSAGGTSYSATALPTNVISLLGIILERKSGGTGSRYLRLANATDYLTVSQSNFDIACAGSEVGMVVEYDFSGGNTVFLALSGNSVLTLNQMGWIDDRSNLLNV